MSWHKIVGVFVLVAMLGMVLRLGTTSGIAQAVGGQSAAVMRSVVGVPVVVRSGGASLFNSPNGVAIQELEAGTIVQAISRTPTGDWIFVEVEAGVEGWLASNSLVSVNPSSLPVYGQPQAEQFGQPIQATSVPMRESSPTSRATVPSTATHVPTVEPTEPTPVPTMTSTATSTATAIPPTATLTATPTASPATPATPTEIAMLPASTQQNVVPELPMGSQSIPVDSAFLLRVVGVVRAQGASLVDGPDGSVVTSIPAGEIITLLQRNEDDSWLKVARDDGSMGWVVGAELITAGLGKVPRVGERISAVTPVLSPLITEAVSEDAPLIVENSRLLATVRTDGSRLNVRSGPGSDFPVVAKAENGNSYPSLSTDTGADWVQIEITDAPDGAGWVSARFVTLNEAVGGGE